MLLDSTATSREAVIREWHGHLATRPGVLKGDRLLFDLLERTLQEFQQRGYGQATLWVLKENAQARGFYEHMGGKLVEEKQEDFAGVPTNQVAYAWELDK